MTLRAIAGLAGLNLFLLVVGSAILWGLRGWKSWTELLRVAGVAYLLGVAAFSTFVTLALVVGIPFGTATVVLAGLVLLAGGLVAGSWRGGFRPALRAPGWRLPRLTVVGAIWTAAIVVYFEALFRSGRLAPMSEWDAWRCWTLRAKAMFHFDHLDRDVFESAACPGYPPGFSVVEAAGFQAMGVADVVTIHLQYWFLAAGFVAALAGLLGPRVRQSVLLPFLLLLLVLPSFTDRVTDGRADLPLAYLLITGAVLVALWLDDRHQWQLAAAAIVLAGALLTKREGLLLLAFVLVAALAATWKEKRGAWPPLLLMGLAAFALALPWRVWLEVEGLRSGAPPGGYLELASHLGRAMPALELVVRTMLDYDLWLLAVPLALAAAVLAALAHVRHVAVFAGTFTGAAVIGCTWAIWVEPQLEITQDYGLNPVVRLVGGPVLTLVALTPLLLERALGSGDPHGTRAAAGRTHRASAAGWVLVLAIAVAYPLSMLVGYSGLRLPGGAPGFPSAEDCNVAADGNRLRVVLEYATSFPRADELRQRAEGARLPETEVATDGCGRVRVYVDDVTSEVDARRIRDRSLAAGFAATIEGDPDP